MATPGGPHFIRVHPVLGAMGLSGLGLWEAEPTGRSSIFLNVPSATALHSEGKGQSVSMLVVEERHFYVSTWLLAAEPISLTSSGWSRPPRCVEGGWSQGRPGGSREPLSKGELSPRVTQCRQGCEMDNTGWSGLSAGPAEEVTFKIAQDNKRMSASENLVEGIPGREDNTCKGPGAGVSLACLRNSP